MKCPKKAYIKTFISTAGTVLGTHEDARDSASAAANTTQVHLHHIFPALMLLMNLWIFVAAASDARQNNLKWPLPTYTRANLFRRPYLFVWSQFRCRSQGPDKLVMGRKTSARRAKNISPDKYQNKVIMDRGYEPAHKFNQWRLARREMRRGMLIVLKWKGASRYCAESPWSIWWKILSIDCILKTTAIDSQNITVPVCVRMCACMCMCV